MIPEAVTEFKQRKGDWILLPSGTEFYVLDPRAEEIHISDIAHNLANNCRFHGCKHYSVAEPGDPGFKFRPGWKMEKSYVQCMYIARSLRVFDSRMPGCEMSWPRTKPGNES